MKHTIRAIALLSIASIAFAQETEVQMLPTTVVTGELWESDIQKTTASVTVFDQAALENSGTQHFEDVIHSIPNLTWTGGTSRPRYIQIRGIGENSQFEGETPDSAVRFLIDDIDLTGVGTVGNLFDVQQVEVLRGPQAGAFGANAAGGVIKIVSNEPTPYWTGQTEVTVGNDDLRSAGFAVGGPLLESDPEKLTFRLSANKLVQNGFRDNHYFDRDDSNERDELSTRLNLRWIATTDWQFDTTLFYADANNGYDEWSLNNTEFDTYSDQIGRDEQESMAGSIRTTWTGLETVDVTNILSGTQTDSVYSYDNDWGAGYVAWPFASGYLGFLQIDREREVYSNDLRFDSSAQEDALGFIDRWTLGLYYQKLEEDSVADYDDDFGTMDATSSYENESFALYAQAAHDLSEQTRIILGLRIEQYDVETSSTGADTDYYDGRLSNGNSSEDGTLWGGKLTIEHDINDKHMLFASAARGYKAGGANVSTFSFDFDPKTYEDETLYNFELGLRSNWADGAISTQITGFYLHRKNAQLRDSVGAGGFFRYLTVNGNDAAHLGLEAEVSWYISENWSISAGLGLLETERDSYTALDSDESIDEDLDADDIDDPVAVEIDSRTLANAPSYNYHLRVNYQPQSGLFAHAEVTGSDSYYESNSHNEKRSEFATVNAAIGYRYDNWTFTLWAKNLFDEGYEKRVFAFDNFHPDDNYNEVERRYENPANPRTFGVTANYSW
ncbi:TonB-dependent receptor [Coraliomargarita sp. SDUM461004]|uniref:TonB-dependent receptor n=1 Tax=Thalassobacterium sedimentorum TaxID=3041258 RepID=A0ABU1AK34_9BACT|nr:TonB-dependent receptor [Coraliomargarita sp. SDUM461004]MDQ8195067.1 TonB-dependent receptor [Coraliomargarita sp. SDUM461004]